MLRKPQKTSARPSSDESCATSRRLKWGPLLPNDVGRIAPYFRGRERERERVRKRERARERGEEREREKERE